MKEITEQQAIGRCLLFRFYNDDEVIEKKSDISDQEFEFHKAFALASGGMILSGDLIPALSEKNIQVLKKLLPPTGKAVQFDYDTYTIGRIKLEDRSLICVFNFSDQPKDIEISLDRSYRLYDFLTDEEVGYYANTMKLNSLEPHCAKVLSNRLA